MVYQYKIKQLVKRDVIFLNSLLLDYADLFFGYANADKALVRANMKKHNPESPFLIGESMPGDVIHEAIQKSWIDRQLRFDYFY